VRRRAWLTDAEFAEGFALAQSLPGTNAGNVATYVGLKLGGWRGACAAMSGFILPSTLMMIALAILYRHLRQLPDTERLFHGLNAAVDALILVTAYRIGRNTLAKRWQWVVAVLACLAVALLGATVIEVVLAAGVVGIFIDSVAEKQLERLRRYGLAASRRRGRIAARLSAMRRRRAGGGKPTFVGGQLTRALAEERVRLATEVGDGNGRPGGEDGDEILRGTQLRSVAAVGAAMPLLGKLGRRPLPPRILPRRRRPRLPIWQTPLHLAVHCRSGLPRFCHPIHHSP
jgi:chromate transport protein ChrA